MGSQASVAVTGTAEMRHRLRTPLNHLIGYSEILIEDYPEHAFTIEVVLANARGMLDAVQRFSSGDHSEPAGALAQNLRHTMTGHIEEIRKIVRQLRGQLPHRALADLERIAAAAAALDGILAVGGAISPAVSAPVDRMDETRLTPVSGPGRILVVDDNELNLDVLSRQLRRNDHEVSTAHDGGAALEMLRTGRFELILLDLMMPGMSGFDVLQSLRADPALSGVAVIVVSALNDIESVVRCVEAGAEDYLFKPVNPTLMRARVKSTLDKMRADEALRRKQRFESIGLLAAGIAHDFNNLLTGIIGHAQLLEQVLTASADRDMCGAIVEAGERAAGLTRQLLTYSGKAPTQMQPVGLVSLIHESEGLIRASLPKKVHLELRLGSCRGITADPNQIRQALLNLTLNAAEAIGSETSGNVAIVTGSEYLQGGDFDVIADGQPSGAFSWFEVRDSGCGMDAATAAKIFEPFFSTRFLGRGLGLAAVAGIVRTHRGVLKVTSAPGRGSVFRIYFPEAREDASIAARPVSKASILVVDDEAGVRQIVKFALERAGQTVIPAESLESAVEIFREHADQIGLVLLDWKTEEFGGDEILARLREIRNEVKVIVSSGFEVTEAQMRFRSAGIAGYIRKPYKMSELTALVARELIDPANIS